MRDGKKNIAAMYTERWQSGREIHCLAWIDEHQHNPVDRSKPVQSTNMLYPRITLQIQRGPDELCRDYFNFTAYADRGARGSMSMISEWERSNRPTTRNATQRCAQIGCNPTLHKQSYECESLVDDRKSYGRLA